MRKAAAPLLRVERLSVDGPSGRLVRNLGFSVERGRTLALIGESGSGKSVTALALMRLLPVALVVAPGAEVFLGGKALPIADERAMRVFRGRRIAMVFQDPMACLNPYLTVGWQIEEALLQLCCTRDAHAREARRDMLLDEVELSVRLARRYPHELSGGQQQRAMIAMALAAEPDLLIADEPTSALDASVQAEIVALLHRLQGERGMAMLFITHDLEVAAALAHDVAVMRRGEVVERGTITDILERPVHAYTRRLVGARRTLASRTQAPSSFDDNSEPTLVVRDLTVDYPGRGWLGRGSVRAVERVSLSLPAGRTLGLVGESGSGKSTLAAVIAGLRRPTGGDVRLLGTSLAAQGWRFPPDLRRACQIVFQNPAGALNPRLKVETLLAEPLALNGVPRDVRRARSVTALEEVGLEAAHLARFPHELSGGQRQRICITRALLSEPRLLVCDEVVSALDLTVQVEVLRLLRDLQRRHGFAMLFIGHDLDVVGWIADEVAVMHAGALVEIGPSDRVLSTPSHHYTQHLLAARLRLKPVEGRLARTSVIDPQLQKV